MKLNFILYNIFIFLGRHLIGFILIVVLVVANSAHIYQLADFMTVFLR